MNHVAPPSTAPPLPAVQCGAATLELVLALLDAGDEASALAALTEGIALLGDAVPPAFLTLDALLRLTSHFNKDGYVELLGHRISVTVDGPETHGPERLLSN